MIEARQLKKSFGPQRVLDGVDLRVEKGESVVIIGRSGGGKSILLKHLIGLLRPDEGDVIIDGESIAEMNERQLLKVRRKFGMLFQGAALFDSLTVAENVAFVLQREGQLTEPEIVLFDEPTTGLDPIVADSIDQLIVRVREQLDVTTVAVTHDMRSARRIGQRILMLYHGRIHFAGTPDEVFQSKDPLVYRFVNGISDPKERNF